MLKKHMLGTKNFTKLILYFNFGHFKNVHFSFSQNSLFKKLLLDKNLVGSNFLKLLKLRAKWSHFYVLSSAFF